jgi:hypothetical protein
MSKFLALINNKAKKENCGIKPNGCRRFRLDLKAVNIAVTIAICVTGVIYLAKINDIAIQGFKMKELDEKQAVLKDNIKKMEMQVAEMQSMQKIQERINKLGMVGVAQVKYVSAGGAVAVK